MLKSIYFTFAHQNNEHQYFTYLLLYSLTDFMIQSTAKDYAKFIITYFSF